jgi:hypothetical protein
MGNLLKPGRTLDAWLLIFTGLDAEPLRAAILAAKTDEEILTWVEQHAIPHTGDDKKEWAKQIYAYRPTAEGAAIRKQIYPEVATRGDIGSLNVFDLIDMDEGRMPVR